jgi:hypothetical protein
VKAEAGALLLAGKTLPVPPHPVAVHTDSPDAAFGDAGYTYEDAVRLAQLWHLPDPGQAKEKAGRILEAGKPLPFRPVLTPEQEFWNSGYDGMDAERLARLWNVSVDQAKVEAGQKLLKGEKLPFKP